MKLKVNDILSAYKTLESSKYQKLSDDCKIKVWKISRSLAPVALKYSEEVTDAQKKLMPSEDFSSNLNKARRYEKLIAEGKNDELPMSADEYNNFLEEFKAYSELITKALSDILEKEEEVTFEPVSESDFGKLMASNDWTLKEVSSLEFICSN
jgi:hypothetical protein